MDLLRASETPEADRATFLTAQLLFWLLAATDGHAKNFSIKIDPGGRFKLAPLYDILSVQPSIDAGEITHNKAKFAMKIGDRRYDVLKQIHPRHFRQTAKACGFPVREFDRLAATILDRADGAIEATMAALPRGFPQALAASIVCGLQVTPRHPRARPRQAGRLSQRRTRCRYFPSRNLLVIGYRRSRPKFRSVILTPGAACRRLYSAR